MGRSSCCSKEGLNRGAWTAHEDKILSEYIKIHGEGRWRNLPQKAGLKRCGKSCRLRWLNYLRPDIKRGNISPDEEELIIRLHKLLGNRWSLIAGRLPGRTDNEIKNYWNTNLVKKVQRGHQTSSTGTQSQSKRYHYSSRLTDIMTKTPVITDRSWNPGRAPPDLMGPNVVRTKAVKCSTKVFFKPIVQQPPHPGKEAEGDRVQVPSSEGKIVISNNNVNSTSQALVGPESDRLNGLDNSYLWDQQLCPSDLLNSDSNNNDNHIINTDNHIINTDNQYFFYDHQYNNISSPNNYYYNCSNNKDDEIVDDHHRHYDHGDLLLSSEELLQDWCHQPNVGPELFHDSFTNSFLDAHQGDNWLQQ